MGHGTRRGGRRRGCRPRRGSGAPRCRVATASWRRAGPAASRRGPASTQAALVRAPPGPLADAFAELMALSDAPLGVAALVEAVLPWLDAVYAAHWRGLAGVRGPGDGGAAGGPPGGRGGDPGRPCPPGGVPSRRRAGLREVKRVFRTGVCRDGHFPCCTAILTAPLHCLRSPRTPGTGVGCVVLRAQARPGPPAEALGRKVWRGSWRRNESSATTRISSGCT